MRFYKIVDGAYIVAIGIGKGGEEIAETEYNRMKSVIDARPAASAGFAYRLTEALQWELHELPPGDPDPELSAEEALEIILGGTA